MIKKVHTRNAPDAIGPYSQAVQAGDYLYVSGQIGIDPDTSEVVEGIEAQTKQVMENLKSILSEADTNFTRVAKFTIYLNDMNNFSTVNDIYGSYLEIPYPARATVEVSRLPKDVLVEMDAVVYTKVEAINE
ncbi:RidA family protein [Virgibacillus sp. DJP39]|uniref:RidA family protein n=1 Tax=Virgibacillus sp. DJP39 TaxID=3409790 RepID=UPI003BB67050